MCYNAAYLKDRMIREAERKGLKPDDLILPVTYNHVSAFSHPEIPVITVEDPTLIQPYIWGLIPEWTKGLENATKIQRLTPNARSETIFEKPAFRNSANNNQRCVIMTSGFFEYHHKNGKRYPYYIQNKNSEVTYMAGLFSHWDQTPGRIKKTVSILTTGANELMAEIHNNPKVLQRGGPRMPVILSENQISNWLDPHMAKDEMKSFFVPFDSNLLEAYTVPQLTGKNGVGNTEKATMFFDYPELNELF